ncbi:MAG: hypothetical protein ABSB35_10185 [Bryobacteraceae bacterium]|jgi:hypothetical protein
MAITTARTIKAAAIQTAENLLVETLRERDAGQHAGERKEQKAAEEAQIDMHVAQLPD